MQPGQRSDISCKLHSGIGQYQGKDVQKIWMSNPSMTGKSHIRFLMALSELRASGERHTNDSDLPVKTRGENASMSAAEKVTERVLESEDSLDGEGALPEEVCEDVGLRRSLRDRLFEAAENGDMMALRHLDIEFPGLDWNMLDSQGRSALMVASELGHEAWVRFLLEQGSLVRIPGSLFERTALHWAALGGNEQILAMLTDSLSEEECARELSRGDIDNLTPLHLASRRQQCSKEAFLYLLRLRLKSNSGTHSDSGPRSSSASPQPTALKPIRAASLLTFDARRTYPSRRAGCPPSGRKSPIDSGHRPASRSINKENPNSQSTSSSPVYVCPNTISPVSPLLNPYFDSHTSSESFQASRQVTRGGCRERWLTGLGSHNDLVTSPGTSPLQSPLHSTISGRGSLSLAPTHVPFPSPPSSRTEHGQECPPVWRRVGQDSSRKGGKDKSRGNFMAKLENDEVAKQAGTSGADALINAVMNERSGGISQVAFGLDVNEKGRCGRTALMVAAELGKHDCMKKLFRLGAHIMVPQSKFNRSAMHWAAATGQGRSLELLMESMTIEEQLQEVNRTDADGKTPLSLAAEAGVAGKDAFVFLIKKGGEYGSVLPTILLNLHVQSPERHTWAGQFPSPPTASRTRSRLSLSSTFT